MENIFPKVTFKDVVNHISDFWKLLDLTIDENSDIPRIVMYNSIQHFNNFERAKEEINLIQIELDRLFTFWNNQKLKVDQQFKKVHTDLFEVNDYLFYNFK